MSGYLEGMVERMTTIQSDWESGEAADHDCDTGHFDRTICACGAMHSYCATCGSLQDPCPYVIAPEGSASE